MSETVTTIITSTIDKDTREVITDIVNLEKVDLNGLTIIFSAALSGVLEDERNYLPADALAGMRNMIDEACDKNAARCAEASAETTTSEATA